MFEEGMTFYFFSSRRRHTRFDCDWSSDVCSSDLKPPDLLRAGEGPLELPGLVQGGLGLGPHAPAQLAQLQPLAEIGRASCREGEKIVEVAAGLHHSISGKFDLQSKCR